MSRGLVLLSRHPVHVIEDILFAVVKQTNPPVKLVESLTVLHIRELPSVTTETGFSIPCYQRLDFGIPVLASERELRPDAEKRRTGLQADAWPDGPGSEGTAIHLSRLRSRSAPCNDAEDHGKHSAERGVFHEGLSFFQIRVKSIFIITQRRRAQCRGGYFPLINCTS